MLRARMGQLLLDAGCITAAQLDAALARQRDTRRPLGRILCEQRAISEDVLLKTLGQQYGLATVSSFPSAVDPHLSTWMPRAWAERHAAVPVSKVGQRLTVALTDPANVQALDEVRFRTGLRVVPVIALESDVRSRIQALYAAAESAGAGAPASTSSVGGGVDGGGGGDGDGWSAAGDEVRDGGAADHRAPGVDAALQSDEMTTLVERVSSSLRHARPDAVADALVEDASPVAELVRTMLRRAARMGVSDVHLEPHERVVRVRFRLDGKLHPVMTYSISLRNAVVSRLKILAHLDIAERRLPQDGRLALDLEDGRTLDVRMAVLPSLHGENVVLRLLNRAGQMVELPALGLDAADTGVLLAALERPHGMVLVTGPTGSGKTTTLYAALQVLNTKDVNIVTVEDPVEYHLTGITQVQVKEDIGLGFARILRAFLRQDPDILMVGEIRDLDTAQIAVRAALTGHRVLSTLHTHDAVRAVTRLLEMGVEPFMVASSVSVIVAQRLVRRVCPECRRPDGPFSNARLREAGFTEAEAAVVAPVRGQGCAACHGTGYRGRVGLFEVLPVSSEFRALILERETADRLKRQALADGLHTIRRRGLDAVMRGLTTIEEVVSVSVEDEARD